MQQALDGVAFLPFGLLVDKWRWQVFSGELTPDTYNSGWWALREQYQGVRAARRRARAEHSIRAPSTTSRPTRRTCATSSRACSSTSSTKPPATPPGGRGRCTAARSSARRRWATQFNAMLEIGQSKPWPEALEAFTGTRSIDGSAILAYYAPLQAWLEEQNAGRTCGW